MLVSVTVWSISNLPFLQISYFYLKKILLGCSCRGFYNACRVSNGGWFAWWGFEYCSWNSCMLLLNQCVLRFCVVFFHLFFWTAANGFVNYLVVSWINMLKLLLKFVLNLSTRINSYIICPIESNFISMIFFSDTMLWCFYESMLHIQWYWFP